MRVRGRGSISLLYPAITEGVVQPVASFKAQPHGLFYFTKSEGMEQKPRMPSFVVFILFLRLLEIAQMT